jgi:hypothetical protein
VGASNNCSESIQNFIHPYAAILADAIFALGKPVILVLQGGRPFAIPEYYQKAAAVINAVCILLTLDCRRIDR